MNCPRCTGTLQKVVLPEIKQNIEVDQCSDCRGVWFDYGELEQVENVVEPVLVEFRKIPNMRDQLLGMHCPYCDLEPLMDKVVHPRDSKVIMDVCEHCHGIWLDGGELEAIQKESWWMALTGLFKKLSEGRA